MKKGQPCKTYEESIKTGKKKKKTNFKNTG
jgi:hypothetical protein